MNFAQHRNHGLSVAAISGIAYYGYYAANYYSITGAVLFSEKLFGIALAIFGLVFVGSLSPDLDIHSTPSKWAARFLAVYLGAILLLDQVKEIFNLEAELHWRPVVVLAFIFVLCKSSKHRGITHAWSWIPLLIGLSIYTENHGIGAFAVGLGTHYLCDSISPFRLENWV